MKGIVGKTQVHHGSKGAQQQVLPHRAALNQLTKGDPMQRTMNNYAKATPSMLGAPAAAASFMKCGGRVR